MGTCLYFIVTSQHWTTPLSLKSPLVKVVHAVQCQDVARHFVKQDNIFTDGVVTYTAQKKKLIEEFYGAEAPQEVDVQPPEVVSTKGSGSRLPSRVEKALKLKSKPLRQCKKCQEWGHHDQRIATNSKRKKSGSLEEILKFDTMYFYFLK
ncbi:hypothetical protein SASPL_114641 [Salvia splendens]|uniref:Uncharacterized protein n=1 Tax=Salvia splendens TaxID=180675 RepID=A0A8X9A1E1_SALSN|nr:hypothetical protein SASPL_114641 [Salvia splendens]